MSRRRLIHTAKPPAPGERTSPEKRHRPAPWRRLSSRYWRWQTAVAEHPAFEPLRSRWVRRLLVVAFAASTMVCLAIFWTQGCCGVLRCLAA